MTVLSLFDGISCGRAALERAGIKVDQYYASEIDTYAEKVSQDNWPDIIRLGDIENWREWDIETPDIIIGGSPCQGFSFAGKQLNFNDPRSKLFFTFADIVRNYHPKFFLLENVKMKQEHQDVISYTMGEIYPEDARQAELFGTGKIDPVAINSALLSAQNRQRLYWCNWKVSQPEDKGILLKDIVEDAITDRDKSYSIDAGYAKTCGTGCGLATYLERGKRQLVMVDSLCKQVGVADLNVNESCKRVYSIEGKAPTLTAICGGNQEPKIAITGGGMHGRNPENPKSRKVGLHTEQMLESRADGKTNTLSTVQKDNVCVYVDESNIVTWRKLTVTECCRLQTLPDDYCKAVSNSRAYHALGNGWTVDVISHILATIPTSEHKEVV